MKLIWLATICCLAGNALALIQPGPCPVKFSVDDFDMDAYLGTWYEHQRYDYDNQFDADCVSFTFIRNADGSMGIEHQFKFYPDLYTVVDPGQAFLSFPDSVPLQGDFNISFAGLPPNEVNYRVIFTNYVDYSIGWNCIDHPEDDNHTAELWLFSRSPTLSEEIENIFESYIEIFFDRVGLRSTLQGRVCLAGASPF